MKKIFKIIICTSSCKNIVYSSISSVFFLTQKSIILKCNRGGRRRDAPLLISYLHFFLCFVNMSTEDSLPGCVISRHARSLVSGFQDLVCFSDGCRSKFSAAALLHNPPLGKRAHGGNVVQKMRCAEGDSASTRAPWHRGLTAGALELAGIAMSLTLLSNYIALFGLQPAVNASVYSDDLPIVDFVLQGGAAHAGARHLEDLVSHVRGVLDALRSDGREVFLLHAPRGTHGIHRAHELARHGTEWEDWPDGLRNLLMASSEMYLAATADERSLMVKY